MPKNPLNKKDLQGVNTELVQIEDQIISIANSLSNAVKSALEDIKDEGKGVAEIFAKDIDKGIKGLAKGLEQTVKNQQQLVKGQLKSADISKQIEDRELKIQMIKNRINGLTAQDIGLKEELNGKLAELNDAEGYHNKLLDDQFNKSKAIEERMGAIGGIVKGISKIPILGELINAEEVMGKIQKKAAETEGAFANIEVAAFGMGQLLGSAFGTLTDPTVVFGAVLKSFQALGKEQREFRKVTGQNANTFRNIGGSLTSTTDLLKASTALSKELGVNASVVFSSETITEVAELTEFMGMGAHEAAQLAKFAKLSGQELSTVTDNMESSFKSFVKTNAVGINISDVMNDVGSASAAVTLSLGSQPAKIQAAAMEARKLGLSLEQVDKIAGSLLDFEQSIQNEMEAEMLIGKEINLDKARQLALANDLEGVAKEIGKNEGIMKAFSSGNRIQQEATAKAMGMSREEMAKMIYQQKLQSGLTSEQAAKAADISLDEAKRLTTQEQISKALEKMAAAAATILDIFAPILSNSVVLFGVVSSIGLILTAKVLTSLKGSVGEMKSLVKGSLSFLKNTKLSEALIGKFYKGGQFMKGGGQAAAGGQRKGGLMGGLVDKVSGGAATAAGKAGDVVGKTSGQAKNLKPGMGKLIKGFFGGLGQGLKLFAKAMATNTPLGPVGLVGPLALAMLTASLIPLGFALNLAAPAFKAFGTIITSIFAGVATVITAVAKGFVLIMENMTMEKIKPMFLLGPALFGIAGGLAAMAIAGLGALPIIGALGALALVAAPLAQLAGVFGGGGDEGNGGEDKIVKKLDELIDIAKKGTVIMMDGNVVGQTVQRSSSGIGA